MAVFSWRRLALIHRATSSMQEGTHWLRFPVNASHIFLSRRSTDEVAECVCRWFIEGQLCRGRTVSLPEEIPAELPSSLAHILLVDSDGTSVLSVLDLILPRYLFLTSCLITVLWPKTVNLDSYLEVDGVDWVFTINIGNGQWTTLSLKTDKSNKFRGNC